MYKISDKNVKGLFDAIAAEDNELVAAYIKDIYVEIFDNTQALDGDELDTFTAQVDVSSDEGTDGINAELDKLYDFCDAHGISLEADSKVAVKEAIDDSTFDKLLDKAFEFGYNYGYSDTFEDFMKKVKPNVKQSLTKDMLIRLEDAFDNGNHEGDIDEMDEALNERELSTKERSISKIFVDNRDKINKAGTKEELVSVVKDLLKDVNPERTRKIFAALDSKKDYFRALQYIYDFILKGDDLGVIKEETIDLPDADKILADLKLEEDCFDCCEDDFGYADDDTKELFSDDDKGEFDDELGFVPDDVMSIDMVADDDSVRESVRNDGEHDHTQAEDVIVDDSFQPDDISELNIK